jgi:hypothetical protein
MRHRRAAFHPHTLTTEEIIDYFGTDLFSHLDADLRDFLLRTALLPTMTVKTAEKLRPGMKKLFQDSRAAGHVKSHEHVFKNRQIS